MLVFIFAVTLTRLFRVLIYYRITHKLLRNYDVKIYVFS